MHSESFKKSDLANQKDLKSEGTLLDEGSQM